MPADPTRRAPVVLVGGPAGYDDGRTWTNGRVIDWCAFGEEAPEVWIYTAWPPWRSAFTQYVYVYRGPDDTGAVLMHYRGILTDDHYAHLAEETTP